MDLLHEPSLGIPLREMGMEAGHGGCCLLQHQHSHMRASQWLPFQSSSLPLHLKGSRGWPRYLTWLEFQALVFGLTPDLATAVIGRVNEGVEDFYLCHCALPVR